MSNRRATAIYTAEHLFRIERVRWFGFIPAGYRVSVITDHAPAWRFWRRARAEAFVDEHRSTPLDALLLGVRGSEICPLNPQPTVPNGLVPCAACGSRRRPIAKKPLSYTASWWEDAAMYWHCAACGAILDSGHHVTKAGSGGTTTAVHRWVGSDGRVRTGGEEGEVLSDDEEAAVLDALSKLDQKGDPPAESP